MIFNTVLNGSWWFYPSFSDFIFMVIITLFIEALFICLVCCSIKIEERKISIILGSVIFANLISAILGYIVLFSDSGGW